MKLWLARRRHTPGRVWGWGYAASPTLQHTVCQQEASHVRYNVENLNEDIEKNSCAHLLRGIDFVIEIKGSDKDLVPKVLELISKNNYWKDLNVPDCRV